MARQKPTLFEQIREEDRASAAASGLATNKVLRIAILVGATVLLMAFLPGRLGDTQRTAFDRSRIGTSWTEESVIAEYPFPVNKDPDTLARQREAAQKATPATVRRTVAAFNISRDRLQSEIGRSTDPASSILAGRGMAALKAAYDADIIDLDNAQLPGDVIVELLPSAEERILPMSSIRDSIDVALSFESSFSDLTEETRRGVTQSLRNALVPTIRVDDRSWANARTEAAQNVATTTEIIQRGDVIVRKGQRVDAQILERLAAYRFGQYLRSTSQFSFLVVLGAFGHAFFIMSMVALYLYYVRRSSFERNGQLASLLAMPVVSAGLGWLTIALPTSLPLEYVIVVPGMAMIVSILYDVRTAIVVTLACSLSVAAARGNDHVIAVVMIAGSAMAAYSATNLRSRTQVFTSILSILIGLVVVTLSIELERATPAIALVLKLGASAVNSVLSPLIAFAVILIMERALNLATDLRLEEFDNINHPLLQQLNERAPGTYQHTMAVVRLSETAASAIGANALLARVGALYHDVGKLEKSEYFIENQIDIDNKHDRLTPKRSAGIIRQHVQDGIELAKEYKLPDRIWKFIPMHHGTILIKHFYAKAIDEAIEKELLVDEQDFRYPGPKPDSKETAIVMLADAAEALSRLVDTSQREEIVRAVEKIITDRTSDGQLNDTPLTLNDLDIIKESFVKSLLGSSHQRVRYKDVPPTPPPTVL
ncbi:MAG TPA: HDIG domain-containing protein [Candidatus Didemnitutus sp.]|nr:HDIG domain-containing protein [Candidatus Didemnitutus sp.]